MPIDIKLDIEANYNEIEAQVRQNLQNYIVILIGAAIPNIKKRVGDILTSVIETSPEYISLLNGELRAQFGLEQPQQALTEIVATIIENIEVSYSGPNTESLGSIVVEVLRDDYTDLIAIPDASYESVSLRTGQGSVINWLEWLLLEGDRIIIAGYQINQSEERSSSRTGRAIMIKGGGWRVPPEFSGTAEHNWLSRVTDNVEGVVQQIIQDEVLDKF